MSDNSIISLQNVNKWFGDFQVLQDVNLEVKKKERIVVCGPSGSGKSTMIRCINRLEEHQESPTEKEVLDTFGFPDSVWIDDLETTKFLYYFISDIQDFNTIEISAKTDSVSGFEWD